ncbi:hypothetical protein [Sodalis ligni]|uniref:Uncharacterized protein n=1 Tax=Sodalis ligni TaxID=2697027 RepID=A0A4V2Q3M9_9GAMM|nr:hypothetical protein [Sodalis ligni]TCL07328.1 hypothetical protein EZJ58_5645 [Sodalis ligni]
MLKSFIKYGIADILNTIYTLGYFTFFGLNLIQLIPHVSEHYLGVLFTFFVNLKRTPDMEAVLLCNLPYIFLGIIGIAPRVGANVNEISALLRLRKQGDYGDFIIINVIFYKKTSRMTQNKSLLGFLHDG